MAKGFKDKGKFRPTEKKKGVSISSSQVSQTSKEPNPDNKKADELKNKKLTSKVEEVFDFGNPEETEYFRVKGVEARPDFDGKVVPVEFYVFSQNQFEATGDNEDMPFFAELVLTPKKLGKKKAQEVQDEVGDPETKFNITDVLLGAHFLPIQEATGKTKAEAVNKVTENVEAVAGLIGFTLDRRINALGETGWDRLAELALDKKFSFGSESN